jgi:hypothetical protein
MKRRAPDGSVHETWCAIFTGRAWCDCDDDEGRGPRRQRNPPLDSGAAPSSKEKEPENA